MQKLLWSCELSQYFLQRSTETPKAHIYELTRKGRPFVWQEEQQVAFGNNKRKDDESPNLVSTQIKRKIYSIL